MAKGNLKPHIFTKEEMSRGGKASAVKKLNNHNLSSCIQMYIDGKGKFSKKSLEKDFLELSGKDRLAFLMSYMPYDTPKLESVKQTVEVVVI